MSECKCTYLKQVGLNKFETVHSVRCELGAYQKTNIRIGYAHIGLDEVKVQMDGLEQIIGEKDNEIQKLQVENEKLRKCVELYANTLSWQHIPCETRYNWFRPIISPEQDCSQVNNDEWCSYGGKLARQTLKELKRGKDE